MNKNKLFASVIGLLFFVAGLSAKDYQVAMFGIKSDGVTLNTRSIQRAVDYISGQGGGRLVFYVGRYLTGSIELKSNVTIRIEEGATLVAVPSVYDFKGVGGCNAIIYADKQKISVSVEKVLSMGVASLCGQVWKSNCRKAISKEMYPVMHRL